MSNFEHKPVLVERCFEILKPALEEKGSVLFDMTLGLGGHSLYFAERLNEINIVGFDRDAKAQEIAKSRLSDFSNRIEYIQSEYNNFELTVQEPNAILFDLGVSSMQLDDADRGFSYSKNTLLDMRMDQTKGQTAEQLIRELTTSELAQIIREYSDERHSQSIAKSIKKALETCDEFKFTTSDLFDSIRRGLPRGLTDSAIKSSVKRVFQALRIAVNNELEILEDALTKAIKNLKVNGRIVVLSYQSLEDKIVKRVFNQYAKEEESKIFLPIQPVVQTPVLKLLTKGAELADLEEVAKNSRAKPVRLRAIQKNEEGDLMSAMPVYKPTSQPRKSYSISSAKTYSKPNLKLYEKQPSILRKFITKAAFPVVITATVVGLLLALFWLNISADVYSVESDRIEKQRNRLRQDKQSVELQIHQKGSTISDKASTIGMVPRDEIIMIQVDQNSVQETE